MAGTTIELLQRLIENPGKVARYKTSTEFSMFGGKPKTTQPFPMPHEVMNDFVTFFNDALRDIKLYPEEPLRAIDFSSWEYEPNQTLLVFLAKYCKGANNDRLAKAVLTAAAQILQKYPGSLMHEFWLLHEIRHALNFDKNDKDPATDTKRKRQELIDKEKEVFRQIKIIYTLLAQNSIQQALKQLKAFAVPIELTLPQAKYALLVLECYRLLPSAFDAITLAQLTF
jgi:hypothetical protein